MPQHQQLEARVVYWAGQQLRSLKNQVSAARQTCHRRMCAVPREWRLQERTRLRQVHGLPQGRAQWAVCKTATGWHRVFQLSQRRWLEAVVVRCEGARED